MRTISVIGRETTGGQPTEITLVNEPPIGSILSGELLIALHAHNSFKVLNSETNPPDRTDFVSVYDGEGATIPAGAASPVDVRIAAPGGGTGDFADFFVSSSGDNAVRKELSVVSDTPGANGEIQLTDVDKFKLYLAPDGMAKNDTLILKVMIVGEVMRP